MRIDLALVKAVAISVLLLSCVLFLFYQNEVKVEMTVSEVTEKVILGHDFSIHRVSPTVWRAQQNNLPVGGALVYQDISPRLYLETEVGKLYLLSASGGSNTCSTDILYVFLYWDQSAPILRPLPSCEGQLQGIIRSMDEPRTAIVVIDGKQIPLTW